MIEMTNGSPRLEAAVRVHTRGVQVGKPNLVFCPDAASTGTGRVSSIWDGRRQPPQAAYLHRWLAGHLRADEIGARCDLAFHPVGFAGPLRSPEAPVRSYRTLSPLTAAGAVAGLLSVARAVVPVGPARLPVRKHGALWCSDFPHRRPKVVGTDGATPEPAHSCTRTPRGAPRFGLSPAVSKKAQRPGGRLRVGVGILEVDLFFHLVDRLVV